jgi:predicted nucleic acid-binding protein
LVGRSRARVDDEEEVRKPSSTLVVDAAILVAAVRGRSTGAIIEVQRARTLVTTDRVVHEARRRIVLGLKRPELLALLDELIVAMTGVVTVSSLEPLLNKSEETLREAVASRNGSTRDAHVLALAWSAAADVWTTDRDFAGTGIATWSTPNLMRGLADLE